MAMLVEMMEIVSVYFNVLLVAGSPDGVVPGDIRFILLAKLCKDGNILLMSTSLYSYSIIQF